ncbi:MAG: DUF4358 domain-containing protein [Lachnospiraceae bacterium]|nr:DUF4358 domain-containing protein [Lachnospiraceae bacterium]
MSGETMKKNPSGIISKNVLLVEFALILLLIGVMTLLLYEKDPRPDVTQAEVVEMFESIAGDASVTPGGTLRIRRVFGLNAADYDLIVYYTPKETMDVCEFLLVRADESAIGAVKSAMESRVASQLAAFDHYGEHQTELLNKAVIRQFGDYICLIVSETPDAWLAAVKALLEV